MSAQDGPKVEKESLRKFIRSNRPFSDWRIALRLNASHRLKKNSDFLNVFRAARPQSNRSETRGKRFRFDCLYIYVKAAEKGARLGLSVSKKVSKRANVRNRMKRCIREAFRSELLNCPADIIVRMTHKPDVINKELFQSIFESLKKSSNFNKLLESHQVSQRGKA